MADNLESISYINLGNGNHPIDAVTVGGKTVPDVSNFITKSVNDLTNYYLKSETYTKEEVNGLIGNILQFHYEIAPSITNVTSPANNVLYLIGPTGQGNDKYEEYVYPDSTKGWTKIGDTSIDLSGYVTTQALNTALADYTTTTDLTTLLASKASIESLTLHTGDSGIHVSPTDKANWNNKQDLLIFDTTPTEDSTNPVTSGGVYKAIVDNELVISEHINRMSDKIDEFKDDVDEFKDEYSDDQRVIVTAIDDLNDRLVNIEDGTREVDDTPTENSENYVTSGGVYEAIVQTEYVAAMALNDLNTRLSTVEESMSGFVDISTYEDDTRAIAGGFNDLNDRLVDVEASMSSFDNRLSSVEASISNFVDVSSYDDDQEVVAAALNYLNNNVSALDDTISNLSTNISYAIYDLTNAISNCVLVSTYLEDEEVIAGTINELNSKFSTYVSKSLYDDDQEVLVNALNELNTRLVTVEEGMDMSAYVTVSSHESTERVIAMALNDLDSRLLNAVTVSDLSGFVSLSDYEDDEYVVATTLNSLGTRISSLEQGSASISTRISNLSDSIENFYFVQGSSSAAGNSSSGSYLSVKWEGTIPNVPAAYDGLKIAYRVATRTGVATAGVVLSIDGTNYYPVVIQKNTLVTTHYPVGSTVLMVFNSTQTATAYLTAGTKSTVTGCWQIMEYDSNTNTSVYQYGDAGTITAPEYPILTRYNNTAVNSSGYVNSYTRFNTAATVNTSTGEISAPSMKVNGVSVATVNDLESKVVNVGGMNLSSSGSFPSGTFNTINQAYSSGKDVVLIYNDGGEYDNVCHATVMVEDDAYTFFNPNSNEYICIYSDDTYSAWEVFARQQSLNNYIPKSGGTLNPHAQLVITDYGPDMICTITDNLVEVKYTDGGGSAALTDFGVKIADDCTSDAYTIYKESTIVRTDTSTSYTINLPSSSGTIALTSQIPTVTTTAPSSGSNNNNVPTSQAVYSAITTALTSVLKYKGTIGTGGTVTSLPASHAVGDVYVVSTAGTYAGKSCEVGDYIICKTAGTSANNAHWDVVNGENQVDNKSASLAAAGSSVTIATIDGTNVTISTPSTWTGLTKTGTITGISMNGASKGTSGNVDLGVVLTAVSFNGTAATISNGSVSISESDPVFSASVAASISAADITNWNSKTSNTGTITGISMNGASKGTSGNVNLGTVVTAISFNGTAASISNGVASISATIPADNIYIIPVTKSGTSYSTTVTRSDLTAARQAGKLLFVLCNNMVMPLRSFDNDDYGEYYFYAVSNSYIYTMDLVSNGNGNISCIYSETARIQNVKTINSQAVTGTGNLTINELPSVSSTDNGKVLQVVNGAWALVSPATITSGSGTPSNSTGNDGDLYLQTS